jgi:hypothetical protein
MAEESEGSSPHSQHLAIGSYPEPVEFNPHPLTNLNKIHSNFFVFQVVSFLRAFPPKPCTLFSPLLRVPHALPTSFTCMIVFEEQVLRNQKKGGNYYEIDVVLI